MREQYTIIEDEAVAVCHINRDAMRFGLRIMERTSAERVVGNHHKSQSLQYEFR